MLFKSKKVRLFMISMISNAAFVLLILYVNKEYAKKTEPVKTKISTVSLKEELNGTIHDSHDSRVITNYTVRKEVPKSTGDFKSDFKDDIFLGDSITKGLVSYNVLESTNVCAEKGIGIDKLSSKVTSVSNIKPKRVFILCGINDINPNLSEKTFSSNYINLLHVVKSKFPSSKIYVQSILPVLPKLEKTNQNINNSRINKCNMLIKEITDAENVKYLDAASIIENKNIDLYAEDGLHFKKNFYNLWLNYLISNAK